MTRTSGHRSRASRARLAALAVAGALWLGIAAVPPAFAGPDDMRVGVIVVTAIAMEPDDAERLGTSLAGVLGEQLLVDVAVGTRDRLGERPSESCVIDAACIQRVGTKLEARELLFLAIIRIGGRVQVSITWADAATGATEARDPIRLAGDADERSAFAGAAAGLLPNARPRPEEPAPPEDSDESTAAADDIVVPVTDDRPRGRHVTRGVWIAGGIGALALAGGTAFGIMALRTEGRLEDAGCHMGPCNLPPSVADDLERQATLSDALFATAVVSGVVAGVLYWRSGRAPASSVAVEATPTSVSLTFSGSF